MADGVEVEITEAAEALRQYRDEEALLEARLSTVRGAMQAVEAAMMAQMGEGEVVPLDDGRVVVKCPGKPPRARINRAVVERHHEALARLGLIREETAWTTPTVAEVREETSRLAALGVPAGDLIYQPEPALVLDLVKVDS